LTSNRDRVYTCSCVMKILVSIRDSVVFPVSGSPQNNVQPVFYLSITT